ncbi:AIM24 family protein [uncultured Ruminococcus sp.]|uniref:AIM24 family protein n=1 Tax=uncultured Ruminococcus sp. TaxID=165186 RepID=UPI0025E99E01|nr:AIM24 family protein [uncultured Ruminococcus sp.]
MVMFETVNELCLKITCRGGGDLIYTKAGAFIGGECIGQKNYTFTKVMLGPQEGFGQALLGQLARRVTGENLPLMKVEFNGDSVTYYANDQQHVVVYKLEPNETISIESENILAFSRECKYGVRFLGQGVISQKGLATSTLTGQGNDSYVAILVDGNPLVLSNYQSGATIEADPDATVCWIGSDPTMRTDISWRNFIGQSSGESYMFEWPAQAPATVIIQPEERTSGVDVSMDGRASGSRPSTQRRLY